MPRRRPRSRARQLPDLREGAAGQPRVLRGEGQPGAGSAVAAGLDGLVLRHARRSPRSRWRWPPVRRRTASPMATRSRRSATSRAPSRSAFACSRSTAPPRSRRSPAPPPAQGVLPHPLRLRRRRVAAVAQVRLRSGDGGRRARPRQASGPGAVRHLVPCRLAAAQGEGVGPRAGDGLDGVPRLRRARHQPVHGQHGRRLPDQVPQGRSAGRAVRPVDLPRAAQALRQPDPGDHHRAGPRHGRQCRHHRDRSRSDLQEERRGRGALGLSRHRQVRRSRRDDGRVDPLRHPHAA